MTKVFRGIYNLKEILMYLLTERGVQVKIKKKMFGKNFESLYLNGIYCINVKLQGFV